MSPNSRPSPSHGPALREIKSLIPAEYLIPLPSSLLSIFPLHRNPFDAQNQISGRPLDRACFLDGGRFPHQAPALGARLFFTPTLLPNLDFPVASSFGRLGADRLVFFPRISWIARLSSRSFPDSRLPARTTSFPLFSRQDPSVSRHGRRLPHPLHPSDTAKEGTQLVFTTRTDTATQTTMAQARDATFNNPSSPHSSSAGADSYKHEGTPETKLTVFSPDDSSARSNRLLTGLNLNAAADHNVHPAHFHHVNTVEGFRDHSVAAEKDPFVTSSTVPKAEQKLSPTASAFRPVAVPLVAHGSLHAPYGAHAGLNANRQLFAPQATARFSSELGVSRCLVLYSPSRPVTIVDVEGYLAVRSPRSTYPSLNDVPLTTDAEVGATGVAVPG